MVQNIIFFGQTIKNGAAEKHLDAIRDQIIQKWNLKPQDFYLLQNGKRCQHPTASLHDIHVVLRCPGGKGGFGSMLRAIGAQIEKTTNREACRDLSGRRLRDINEEKRVKEYLEKKKDEEVEDESVKVQKKITKLLSKPKHEFKDEVYEHQRTELTQNIDEAVEQGFKKALEINKQQEELNAKKRKSQEADKAAKKKKLHKSGLWLGDDFSSSSDTDSESNDEAVSDKAGCSKAIAAN